MNHTNKLSKGQSIGVVAAFIAVCMVVVSDINCLLLEKYRADYFDIARTNRSSDRCTLSVKKEAELGNITGALFRVHALPHLNCSIH